MRPMSEAPRDGTHFLALERIGIDDTSRSVLEWREIWWQMKPSIFGGMSVWAAENGDAQFGEACFAGWIPLPSKVGAFPELSDVEP